MIKIKANLIPSTLCAPRTMEQRNIISAALSRIHAKHCRAKNAKRSVTLILAPHMDA